MDTMFWVTLGINAVVTLVLGVVATIAAPITAAKVVNFFYARRVSRSLKQKQTELRDYRRIQAFHKGTKDQQFYYVYLGTISTACFIASATCIVATVVAVKGDGINERMIMGLLVACIFALVGIAVLAGMYYTAANLENFEEYEKRVKERWPDA